MPPEITLPQSSRGAGLAEPDYSPSPTGRRLLRGGIVTLARDWSADELRRSEATGTGTALLRLALPVGSLAGETGVADLTAATVIEAASAADNKPSLRRRIEAMGGNLTAQIGSRSTAFDITVPTAQWRAALDALMVALRTPASEEQIEVVRRRLLHRRRDELARETIDKLLQVVASLGGAPPQRYLNAIEDRSPTQVETFRSLTYRPQGAILTLWVPATGAAATLDAAERSAVLWSGEDAPTLVSSGEQPPANITEGIYWAPTDSEFCDFALVLPLPHLAEPGALELLLLIECLTMDGVGGRLGEILRDQAPTEPVLRSHSYWNGSTRHLVLAGGGTRDDALASWAALRRAISSFPTDLPSTAEVREAARRLRLRLLSEHADPLPWLESTSSQAMRGQQPANLTTILDQLGHMVPNQLADAARRLPPRPAALAVAGSAPPEDAAEAVVTVTEAQVDVAEEEVPADTAGQLAAAKPYLDSAMVALGVPNKVVGFAMAQRVSTEDGVFVDETVWFQAPSRLRRVRQVLATTIETIADSGSGVEVSGETVVELEKAEVDRLLEQARRHPIMLIAAHARGGMEFRLVSRRRQGDREVAVLELVDPTHDRLRIAIDAESGLVRSVETTEWRPDLGTRVQVTENYSDYRRVGRLRAPHFCVRVIDRVPDPVSFSSRVIELRPPTNAELERGGPMTLGKR